MTDAKTRAAASIARAKEELALAEVQRFRRTDPGIVGLVAHAVRHYISVTTATVDPAVDAVRLSRSERRRVWLDGIACGTGLMQHVVGRLVEATAPGDFPLTPDDVNLEMLVRRSCEYLRALAPEFVCRLDRENSGPRTKPATARAVRSRCPRSRE